jgi:hypothetical protein
MKKGDKVRVLINPYGEIMPIAVGTIGVVERPGKAFATVRFGSMTVGCWLLKDDKGRDTLEVVR